MAIKLQRAKLEELTFEYDDGAKLTIKFDPKNQVFMSKSMQMYKCLGITSKDFEKFAKEFEAEIDGDDYEAGLEKVDKVIGAFDACIGNTETAYKLVDEMFGTGTAEFFSGGALNPEYLLPLVEALGEKMSEGKAERNNAAAKYIGSEKAQ